MLFLDLPFILDYLDDIIITGSRIFKDHIDQVEKVLGQLQKSGFQVHSAKSQWVTSKVEYWDFSSLKTGPNYKKKIQGINAPTPPKNKKDPHRFVGMVNFYKEMWQHRAHILKPLIKKIGKGTKFVWKEEMNQSFQKMKTIMTMDTILTFPEFSSPLLMQVITKWVARYRKKSNKSISQIH